VVNDILDFSKIEAGKLKLETRGFDLHETIESVAKTLALQAHRQGIELMYEIAPNVPRRLIGDASRLRQIFLNLLGDAVKGTERGEVCLRAMLIAQDESRSTLQFTIADTSSRTADDSPTGQFHFSFEHGSSSSQPSGELGLTISARLVGLMEGRIWADADQNGRRLHFTVMLGTSGEQPKTQAHIGRLLLRGARALIVDDNATHRRMLGECLTRAGMRTVIAGSASEGLERLQ